MMHTEKSNKFRINFFYVDPYTWEIKKKEIIINISGSENSARKWVKQAYWKPTITNIEMVGENE